MCGMIYNPENLRANVGEEEMEELVNSEMEMKKSEERDRRTEMGGAENGEISKNAAAATMIGAGYDKNMPPEDDCCPICFDDFRFPCRTTCGHWFCSSCFLELWRYQANSKHCKCPICGCLILNLVPQSSVFIHQGEEVGKILRDIQLYNNTNIGGLSCLMMRAAAVVRRGLWENLNLTMLEYICNSMHKIGLVLGIVYEVFEFQFFPNGGLGIAVWFDLCMYGVVMFLLWQRWITAMRRLP